MHRSGVPRAVRRFLLVVATFAPTLAHAQGYGYERAADPLVLGVKATIAAAREGKPAPIDAALESLAPSIEEIAQGRGIDLAERIAAAHKSGNSARLAYALTELVYHHLRHKLERNREDRLLPPPRARRRLDAALQYYEEILSHTVRRADSAEGTRRHEAIIAAFAAMRGALGSEGLFGVGARDPRPAEFARAATAAIAELRAVYEDFAAPRADELGADPPAEPPAPPPAGAPGTGG